MTLHSALHVYMYTCNPKMVEMPVFNNNWGNNMLTNTEKEILGYMVDMGFLKGQDRVNAGANDETAREHIAAFKTQMSVVLPRQIEGLQTQLQRVEVELNQAQDLLALLG